MIEKRKICVVTGTRAEYGLLYWLMKEISQDHFFEFQLVVTGMHLAPEFGLTYKQISSDGFEINAKVEMLLSSDTPVGVSKSIGLGIIGFADVFEDLKPDIIVVLGDRSEIFAAVSAAMIARVPVAHIHGGETTEGAYDESMRHSITKMSHLHFTSTEIYRNRVIQLGEQPQYVFDVGAPGIDNIKRLKLMSRDEFEKSINFKLGKKNLLVTFHPVTLERSTAKKQFLDLLVALNELEDTYIIFTKANSDVDGRVINSMIDEYVQSNSDNSIAYTSLGQLRYLSCVKHVDGVVGNSSSGLAEVPSFKKGTINIGDRQRGRIKADSVIDCQPDHSSIRIAISQLFSEEFRKKTRSVINPYGAGGTAEKIVAVLKDIS
ncbi:MAG TPA: UDP-N-acetylglucosamine 2-epimerase (hydrolyzing), partial [Rhodospirillales bacterium]|nr:UDP-N-acetylglucosamine 2-epimerase (hydrolyzing) [Rhodospirillales bacterium]